MSPRSKDDNQARRHMAEEGAKKKPTKRKVWRTKSLDARMREQEKQLTDQTANQRRKRRAAKDVYRAIGYDLMYRDGICQVEEGLFSQTIAFDVTANVISTDFTNAN